MIYPVGIAYPSAESSTRSAMVVISEGIIHFLNDQLLSKKLIIRNNNQLPIFLFSQNYHISFSFMISCFDRTSFLSPSLHLARYVENECKAEYDHNLWYIEGKNWINGWIAEV